MGCDMAGERATNRSLSDEQARSDLLDGVFGALASETRRTLLTSVCDGVVTGAALADKHKFRRDEVSRQVDVLERGGLLDARRDGRWVRFTPSLTGVWAAKAWVFELRADAPPSTRGGDPWRRVRTRALGNPGRRSLLLHIRSQETATQVELRRLCGLSQPLASRSLAQLEACGLVKRQSRGWTAALLRELRGDREALGVAEPLGEQPCQGRDVAAAVVLPDPRASSPSRAHDPATSRGASGREAPLP